MALGAMITAGAGLIGGAAKFFEGRKMQKRAEKLIADFKWQELENPYEDVQVSTMGSDLRREEAARTMSTSTNALRAGGNRAIAGGLGRVQAQNNFVNKEIAANLDEQQKKLDYAKAAQDVNNQAIVEKRQTDELAGYGSMMNMGMGLKFQSIDNAVNAVGMIGSSIDNATKPVDKSVATGGLTGFTMPYDVNQTQGNASLGFGNGAMS